MGGRNRKQIAERWREHLDSSILHTPWTAEEDALLLRLRDQGLPFATIAKRMTGRPELQCKNRHTGLRPDLRRRR